MFMSQRRTYCDLTMRVSEPGCWDRSKLGHVCLELWQNRYHLGSPLLFAMHEWLSLSLPIFVAANWLPGTMKLIVLLLPITSRSNYRLNTEMSSWLAQAAALMHSLTRMAKSHPRAPVNLAPTVAYTNIYK